MAHVVAFETFRQPVPIGLELDHLVCDNRPCIDWWHVEPVTHRENVLRSLTVPSAHNARKTRCKHGHSLSGQNLHVYLRPNGVMERVCLICQRARGLGWRAPKTPVEEVMIATE